MERAHREELSKFADKLADAETQANDRMRQALASAKSDKIAELADYDQKTLRLQHALKSAEEQREAARLVLGPSLLNFS